jgi:hypothetical protein
MATHEIEIIVVSATGSLAYKHNGGGFGTGDKVHVDPGDFVKWFGKDEKFGIHFKDNASPFETGEFQLTAQKRTSGGSQSTPGTMKIKLHVVSKSYPYFVASAKQSGSKHVITDDPELIVDGTGGGDE